MWKNKRIKQRARKSLKANYLAIIMLTFLLAFFGIISSEISQFIGTPSAEEIALGQTQHTNDKIEGVNTWESTDIRPGLVSYLGDYFSTTDSRQEIASATMDNFKGSGGFLYNVMYRVDQFIFSHDAAARIVLVLAITGYLAYAFLLRNILHVGFSRFLMETRTYQKTPMRRLFFLFGKGRVMHSAFTLIARTLQLALCGIGTLLILSLTLFLADWTSSILLLSIGFLLTGVAAWYWVSRHYALYLVPYIVAENPEVTRKEAFQLSADMMQGNRIHALGFDLSYVGLGILSLFTFGLLSVFYITPQRYLGRTEIYMALRQHAIEENLPYSYCLDDEYLEHPPQALLEEEGIQPDENMILYPTAYPQLAPKRHNWLIDHIQDMNPTRHYTLLTLVLFFFIFSIIGWCWEVLVYLVKDGAFIKRGTLMGPWLPIYGTGGLMILIFLRRLANHPALLFFCTMALCSTLEYATSWAIEAMTGLRYWDYSSFFMNLNGRICLEGALTFAIGGFIFVYIASPFLDNLLAKIQKKQKLAAAAILLVLFSIDVVYSHFHPNEGRGITDESRQTYTAVSEPLLLFENEDLNDRYNDRC